MQRFKNKTVIVTGGGGGIGIEICRMFAGEGANVILSDLSLDVALRGASAIGRSGLCVSTAAIDVTNKTNVEEQFGKIIKD